MARRPASTPPRRGFITDIFKLKQQKQQQDKRRAVKIPHVKPTLPKRPPPLSKNGKPTSKVSFAKLFANASITDAKYAPDVSLIKIKKYANEDGYGLKTITIDHKPPRKWNQIILAQDDMPLYRSSHVWVSCNCLVGDTKVLTDQGWRTIFSLTDPNPTSDFPINYIVNGKIFKGSTPWNTGVKPVWEMGLENGKTLRATAEHEIKVLTDVNVRNVWKNHGRNMRGEF